MPKGFRKQSPSGVKVDRQDLSSFDVTERDGYRITTPLCSLPDAAASTLSAEHLVILVQDALEPGLVRRKVLNGAVSGRADRERHVG